MKSEEHCIFLPRLVFSLERKTSFSHADQRNPLLYTMCFVGPSKNNVQVAEQH